MKILYLCFLLVAYVQCSNLGHISVQFLNAHYDNVIASSYMVVCITNNSNNVPVSISISFVESLDDKTHS